ncbi:hypothetical protein H7I53_18140 [Mycolicibacterium pulveris]|uniref:hypothetical protein n=1 Tax=Mycolicibacterium pulveris TaxID=36813 RepID=UPI0013D6CA18|nr:hypothetical protein [Mycolicibacterium pulveris]MCV6982136.1 hypothetical protein [Mycolicibacterium pulveris]
MALTVEQRWLLMTMGGRQIVDALIGPGGVNHLMQSRWSSSRVRAVQGAPEWMVSFETRGGKIVSPAFDEPRVTVTAAQINKYAKTIPAEVRSQLEQLALDRSQHTWQINDWCLCGREAECLKAHEGDPLYGGRHHPSKREYNQHLADGLRIRAYEKVLLAKALRLDGREAESGQLELFEAVS